MTPTADGSGVRDPYIGLAAYEEQHADFFFGRDREIGVVVGNLRVSRLTLFYGESGVGKSSILRAGAMHAQHREIAANLAEARAAVEDGEEPEQPPLAASYFRGPWAGPLPRLMGAIHASVEEATGQAVPPWTAGDDPLQTLRGWTQHVGTILVVLDQFEEYFLYHPGEEGPGTVAGLLTAAVTDTSLRVNFLLSIREDSLAKLDRFKKHIPIYGNVLRIDFLDDAAARKAIEKPLERYSQLVGNGAYRAEPELVEEVIRQARKPLAVTTGGGAADASDDTGVKTPVLQLVLQRLWKEEHGLGSRVLRLETFVHRLHGAENIFRAHLGETMASLTEREKDVAAASFRQLVTPSGSKIAQSATDLGGYSDASGDEVEPMLGKLVDGRILDTVPPAPGRDERRFEIVHDSLGPTLLAWSNAHAEQRAREAGEHEADERARMARRRTVIAAGIGAVILLAVAIVGWLAYSAIESGRQADTAERVAGLEREQKNAARAMALLDENPHQALRVALASVENTETRAGERALRQALSQSRLRVSATSRAALNHVAVSANGDLALSVGDDGVADLIDLVTGELRSLSGHQGEVWTAAFHPSGATAVTGGEGNAARIWDVESGELVRTLTGHTDSISVVAFSPDDPTVVLTGSLDGTARIWDPGTGRALAVLRTPDGIAAAAFAPNGAWVATAGFDGDARLWKRPDTGWDAARPEATHVLHNKESAEDGKPAHDDWVNTVAFSPKGRRLLTSSDDETARIWDVAGGKLLHSLEDHDRGVLDADFSPDGTEISTVADKTLHRRGADGTLYQYFQASTDWVSSVAYNPDGTFILTVGGEGVARLWEASTGGLFLELRGHTDRINAAAFSPDGKSVVTVGSDKTTRVWDVTAGLELRWHYEWVQDVALSRGGEHVYTVAADSWLAQWDAKTGKRLWEKEDWGGKTLNGVAVDPNGEFVVTVSDDGTGVVWTTDPPADSLEDEPTTVLASTDDEDGHTGPVTSVAVDPHPDRPRHVVTGGSDETAIIWTWKDGEGGSVDGTPDPVRRLDADPKTEEVVTHQNGVVGVGYALDGSLLVTTGVDKVARVWDPETAALKWTFRKHAGVVGGLAFHPGGKLVATASDDRTVWVWELDEARPVRKLEGADAALRAVAFNAKGNRIAAAGASGMTYVWAWPSGKLLAAHKMHADLVNAVAFHPDGRIVSASDDGTARLYRCRTCGTLDDAKRLAHERVAAID